MTISEAGADGMLFVDGSISFHVSPREMLAT